MKNIVLSAVLLFSANAAHADNWSDHCNAQAKPELEFTFPTAVIPEVMNGKITASIDWG